jgi:hypothetical protein
MCHMEKLQLEISLGVILQMHTLIVVIISFLYIQHFKEKIQMEYIYIYWHTYPKILKSVKWIKNTQKHFEIVVINVLNFKNHLKEFKYYENKCRISCHFKGQVWILIAHLDPLFK